MSNKEDEFQHLSGIGAIGALLRRLKDEHSLLSAHFPDSRDFFHTAVVDVNPAEGYFLLDEFNSREGHERVKPGLQLRILGRQAGVETRFLCRVLDVGVDDKGLYYYRSQIPDSASQRQRRHYHRVPVRLTLAAGANFANEQGEPSQARLTDLSVGGIGGQVTRGSPLRQGGIYACTIQLPGQPPFTTRMEIRFAQMDTQGRQQRFGGKFLDLSPHDQRRLARTVMELERELRRST